MMLRFEEEAEVSQYSGAEEGLLVRS